MSCACVCCLLVRTRRSRQPWHPLAPSFGGRASIHRSSGHPRSVGPSLGNAGRDLGRGFRAGGVVARRGEQNTRVRGLQPSSCFPTPPHPPKRNGTGDVGGHRGDFQGKRPSFLRPYAQGCNRTRARRVAAGHWDGFVIHAGDFPIPIPIWLQQEAEPDTSCTHWKERVTHVTQGPSFPPSSC